MENRINATPVVPQYTPTKPVAHANLSTGASATVEPEIKVPKSNIQVDTEGMQRNLDMAITKLNEQMQAGGRGLSFSVDPALGRPVVIVRNEQTGEVVRQIPNEVIVQVAHNFDRLKGVLHNAVV
ncbi:MAG: flagellar protein FlaG [Flavobacteriia bacterium]|jgi:flagellar protein FlaG|nr:flagellar protein FlaG [Flavobacteriia bacterium]